MQNLPVNCQVHIMPDSHDKNEEDLCSNGSAADAPEKLPTKKYTREDIHHLAGHYKKIK